MGTSKKTCCRGDTYGGHEVGCAKGERRGRQGISQEALEDWFEVHPDILGEAAQPSRIIRRGPRPPAPS